MVDNVACGVDQITEAVDEMPIQIVLVIVARVLRDVVSEPPLDPSNVKLSEVIQLGRLLMQDLPEFEHNLGVALLVVLEVVLCVIDQVTSRVDLSAQQIDRLSSYRVCLQDDRLRDFTLAERANYIRDLVLFACVSVEEWYAAVFTELGVDEADAALVIDDILVFIDQIAAHVHRPVEPIGELPKLVRQPNRN